MKELYKKHKEIIDYLFWGGVAFFLSMFLFWLFADRFGWNEVTANNVDWVICVIFTFITNKLFVFHSKTDDARGLGKEFVSFVAARVFTLLLEDLIIWIGCTKMGYNEGVGQIAVKFIAQFVVIVTNYILSKLIVFRKKTDPSPTDPDESTKTGDRS
ncbi:MAG: GtrA family protein [Lachnospiraceae bacterium]|nr:GtrA family protein [Lachnospiraceae bacterium]